MLENRQQAIMYAAIFAIVPFASWLSVALVCLITLRKGAKAGLDVLLPAMVVHAVPFMMWLPLTSVIINTVAAYLPCYVAAIVLRRTCSWQMVVSVFVLFSAVTFLLMEQLAPDIVIEQFNQFKSALSQYHEYKDVFIYATDGFNGATLAYLYFGIQISTIVISAIVSLMFARSIQARLFMPDGFKLELAGFRANQLSLLLFLAVIMACYYEMPLGIFLIPFALIYFFAAGFNLAYFIFARKWQFNVFALLLLIILLKPTIVLLAYIIFGTLDSLINLRLYLPNKVREST